MCLPKRNSCEARIYSLEVTAAQIISGSSISIDNCAAIESETERVVVLKNYILVSY